MGVVRRMPSPVPREEHARESFRRVLDDFLRLDESKNGSVTVHFQHGRVRRVEWRTFDDAESWYDDGA